jgi:hypothetical protein
MIEVADHRGAVNLVLARQRLNRPSLAIPMSDVVDLPFGEPTLARV